MILHSVGAVGGTVQPPLNLSQQSATRGGTCYVLHHCSQLAVQQVTCVMLDMLYRLLGLQVTCLDMMHGSYGNMHLQVDNSKTWKPRVSFPCLPCHPQ